VSTTTTSWEATKASLGESSGGAGAVRTCATLESILAKLIKDGALVLIAQDLVRFRDILEFLLCIWGRVLNR